MKKLLIIILLFHHFNLCYCQNENDNVFNEEFKEIVFTQIFNNLEVSFPLFIATPGVFLFANIHYINNKIIFNESLTENDNFSEFSYCSENELLNILDCVFIPSVPLDSNIQIRARCKNKLLYNLIFIRDKDFQILKLSLPNKSSEKEAKYVDGQLKSLVINKNDVIEYVDIKRVSDSLVITTKYNTNTQKYSIIDIISHNNAPATEIYYDKSKNRQNKKIKKIIQYNYKPNGKLRVKNICNKNGIIRDSIKYFYDGDLLNAIINNNSEKQSSVFYKYKGNLITNKSIRSEDKQVDIEYAYDNNNRIESFQIYEHGKESKQKYLFEYNTDTKLISVKYYTINTSYNDVKFQSQYLFSYFDNQILKSLMVTDRKGNITKEIIYEIDYLRKK
ncbi:MAG: hypothetical protein K8R37_02725 [Bacteroidales bacterium]|nr:hypothetical protein [Bacteroidales bacterium]